MSIPQGLPHPPGWEKRREEMMQATPPYLRNTPIPGGGGIGPGRGGMTQGPSGQQQAPRPRGLQRAATGFADWMTGNKWDFDQRGPGGKFLDLITKGSKNEKTGTTFSQDVENMPPIPPINPMDVMQMGGGGGIGSNEMLFDYRRPVLLDGTYEQGQGRYNPFEGQTVNGVRRTPENSSIQQDPSGRYNPFKGQTVTLPDGRVVERTPLNSSPYGF